MTGDVSDTSFTSSRLFQSPNDSVLLVDIPRSIEESQVPPGQSPTRRLISAPAATEPFVVPEPRYGDGGARSQAAQVADLMTEAAVDHALNTIVEQHDGPWCLPRILSSSSQEKISGLTQYIPGGAQYVQASLQDSAQDFAGRAPCFDLVVLDPPWPNRSARRRSNKYDTVKDMTEMRQLLSHVPIHSHLAPNGIVAVWVTNKESILDFVLSPGGLFSSWGLQLVSEWTWLKVTSSGDPITPLDSAWRKPWEKLLIASRGDTPKHPNLTLPRVLIAVPDVHSRKPSLRGVFEEILGQEYIGLEVFARNLTAGWWAWGNEVLRFQGIEHWVVDERASHCERRLKS
ncbi:hypothetical protein NLU13_0802 [Sarocladium strictum]|uniref:MT-A70 family n=1 Tax=Sarocladium strictum TaxID=5046 RepID=A0AA39GQI2_SARSR|nr:hypothetical protein NLU13_0802 [Sarocladium strictum]